MESLMTGTQMASQWAIPGIILIIILFGRARKVPMYETFVSGAKEGFDIAVMIIPYLVAILSVIAVFRASGALDDLKIALGWVLGVFGLEQHADKVELLPMALIRPLSGSGAQGIMVDLMKTHGPDSYIGFAASVLQGSTETTFYILTVYFGSVGIKKIRHTLSACLIADGVGLLAGLVFATVFFAATR